MIYGSRDSLGGPQTRLWAGRSGARIQTGAINVFVLSVDQTDSGANPSYSVGTLVISQRLKRPGRKVNHASASGD